jgi:dUTP pyrophosphatase
MKVYKIRKDAKLPQKAHAFDAGYDLFYCPNGSMKKLYDTSDFHIPAGESRVLPTGLKVQIPPNTMLEIKNKSGIASKKQLLVGACVVDPGYNGEVFVNLHNVGKTTQVIKDGQKLAQCMLVPLMDLGFEEVFEDNLNVSNSTRGDGALGSTGEF